MKYICPTCGKEFDNDKEVSKHFLKCWKEQNPHHKSKPAPRSNDINTNVVSDDIVKFLNSFNKEVDNERSDG